MNSLILVVKYPNSPLKKSTENYSLDVSWHADISKIFGRLQQIRVIVVEGSVTLQSNPLHNLTITDLYLLY